jgi:hypothetical protein
MHLMQRLPQIALINAEFLIFEVNLIFYEKKDDKHSLFDHFDC